MCFHICISDSAWVKCIQQQLVKPALHRNSLHFSAASSCVPLQPPYHSPNIHMALTSGIPLCQSIYRVFVWMNKIRQLHVHAYPQTPANISMGQVVICAWLMNPAIYSSNTNILSLFQNLHCLHKQLPHIGIGWNSTHRRYMYDSSNWFQ